MELLLVISILAVLISVFFFNSDSFRRAQLMRYGLNDTLAFIRESREQAIAESTGISLQFFENIVMIKKDLDAKKTPSFKLLAGGLKAKEQVTIGFNSAGHPIQAGTITLIDQKGTEKHIAIAVGTGRVRSY